MKDTQRFGSMKGVTPVIAIVLLLVVTVFAVGTVYTQIQSISEQGSTEFATQARSTYVQIDSLARTSGGENVTLVYTNRQDSVTIGNTSDMLQVSYKPNEDSGYQSFGTLESIEGAGNLELSDSSNPDSSKTCLDGKQLSPGETTSCTLGVKWPDATESFGIRLSVRGAANSDSLDCTVSTSNTISCS